MTDRALETGLALASILGAWTVHGLALLGTGLLVRGALGLRALSPAVVLSAFWAGWAATLALLQLWHLALAVDARALAVVAAIGALGLCGSLRDLRRLPAGRGAAAFLAIALLVAARATAPPLNYDTGLYHLAAIDWAAEHPIVPGLGNLHGRLAFNSSYFLWAALLDAPMRGLAGHLASGLLLLPVLAEGLAGATRVLRGSTLAADVFRSVMLLPVGIRLRDPDLSSPAPDFALWLVGLALGSRLFDLLVAPPAAGDGERRFEIGVVVALALSGAIVKVSFTGLAVAGLAGLLHAERRAVAGPIALGLVAIALPWMLRGVVLSGYPLYPSAVFAAPVEWRVPEERALSEAAWVASWARQPGSAPQEVLGDFGWVAPWAGRLVVWETARDTTLPALLGALLAALALRRAPRPAGLSFALVPLTGAGFWFAVAPDPRFAGATFWLLACAGVALVSRQRAPRRVAAVALLGFAAATSTAVPAAARDASGLYPVRRVPLRAVVTESGLAVFVPVEGDQTWNAPLPSAPDVDPRLRLREPGELGSGFALTAARAAP